MSNSSSERLGALFTTSQGVRDSATDPSPGPLGLTGVLFSQPHLPFHGGAALVHGYQDAPFWKARVTELKNYYLTLTVM